MMLERFQFGSRRYGDRDGAFPQLLRRTNFARACGFSSVIVNAVNTDLGLRRRKAYPNRDPNFWMRSGNAAFFITKF